MALPPQQDLPPNEGHQSAHSSQGQFSDSTAEAHQAASPAPLPEPGSRNSIGLITSIGGLVTIFAIFVGGVFWLDDRHSKSAELKEFKKEISNSISSINSRIDKISRKMDQKVDKNLSLNPGQVKRSISDLQLRLISMEKIYYIRLIDKNKDDLSAKNTLNRLTIKETILIQQKTILGRKM